MAVQSVNVPVSVGGMDVAPGDLIHMDENGAVKFPAGACRGGRQERPRHARRRSAPTGAPAQGPYGSRGRVPPTPAAPTHKRRADVSSWPTRRPFNQRAGVSAAKLFAVLILLGAVAVLITGSPGYVRARDALEQTIFNQLTATRETQGPSGHDLLPDHPRRHAAARPRPKMVVDAMRGFREAVDELDAMPVPDDVRKRVVGWYETDYMPMVPPPARRDDADRRVPARLARRPTSCRTGTSSTIRILQGTAQAGRRMAGVRYLQQAPCALSSAAAHSGVDAELRRPAAGRSARPAASSIRSEKEAEFGTSLRAGPYPHFQPRGRRRALRRRRRTRRRHASEDFADYLLSNGAPQAFMAAPVIDQGVVIGVLVAQLSIDEIDDIVTGGSALAARGLRRHRRGLSGRARLPRSRSEPAHLLREPRPVFRAS